MIKRAELTTFALYPDKARCNGGMVDGGCMVVVVNSRVDYLVNGDW